MIDKKSDGPHSDKKSTQTVEINQLSKSDKHRVITGSYNPLVEVSNTNNLDKFHLKKSKTYKTRVTILTL